jgi:DNA-binding MarR family transcriptional regulator
LGSFDEDQEDLTQSTPAISFRVLNEIGIIAQLSGAKLEAVLPLHMTMAQFRVLNHFSRLGGERNIMRLAKAFQVSKPTMGGIIDTLSKKGLVVLRPDPDDKRSKLVSITDKGREAHENAVAMIAPEMLRLEAALGVELFETLQPMLEKLRKNLDETR